MFTAKNKPQPKRDMQYNDQIKKTQGQAMIYKTLRDKLKIQQDELH